MTNTAGGAGAKPLQEGARALPLVGVDFKISSNQNTRLISLARTHARTGAQTRLTTLLHYKQD